MSVVVAVLIQGLVVDLQTALGFLFGVGGVGAITVMVTSYRKLKTGKISDDDSIILRLHRELGRQETRADDAEQERDTEARDKQFWREQAWTYRLQLLEHNIVPKDKIEDKK
jgi:hypothetical protein